MNIPSQKVSTLVKKIPKESPLPCPHTKKKLQNRSQRHTLPGWDF